MLINLVEDEIDTININKYNLIYLEDFFNNDNPNENYENYFLIISYVLTPMIAYKSLNNNLYPTENEENLKMNKIANFCGKKILTIHDIHDYTFDGGYDTFIKYCKLLKIDYVIGNYIYNKEYYIINNLLNSLKIKHCVISNLVRCNIFKDYKEEKQYDILIYGHMAHCYPLRCRMKNIILKQSNLWKTRVIDVNELHDSELSKEINKSYLSVATCSIYEYLVLKYFEIPFSESLIIGNMPKQGEFFFDKNDYVDINMDMSDDEIINIINNVLIDKKSILEKTKALSLKMEVHKVKYLRHYYVKSIDYFLMD